MREGFKDAQLHVGTIIFAEAGVKQEFQEWCLDVEKS